MPYEKQTWTTGDTITAEKLNYMENGIEDASGYECESSIVNETIITTDRGDGIFIGDFEFVGEINALNELEVVFDGTEYTLPYDSTYNGYGESQYYNPSFINYPLLISATNADKTNWKLYTSTGGTHTIVLPTVSKTEIVNITSDFNTVVNHIIEEQSIVESFEVYQSDIDQYSSTMTYNELSAYCNTYHHMPICYFEGVPFTYAGVYMSDTMPFYNNICFVGFKVLNGSTASMHVIILNNSENPITVQNISLT